MITKAELDKMVEERAEYYATNEGATIEKIEAFTVDKHLGNPQQYEYVKRYNNDSFCSFKSGASFVTGILQDEIDELKRSNVNLFDTVCDFERGIECLQSDRTKLENQLSEANATIQSLKDENKKFREALEWYADRNNWEFESYKNDCKDRVKFSDLGVKSFNGENNFADYACSSGGRRARQALEGVSK